MTRRTHVVDEEGKERGRFRDWGPPVTRFPCRTCTLCRERALLIAPTIPLPSEISPLPDGDLGERVRNDYEENPMSPWGRFYLQHARYNPEWTEPFESWRMSFFIERIPITARVERHLDALAKELRSGVYGC